MIVFGFSLRAIIPETQQERGVSDHLESKMRAELKLHAEIECVKKACAAYVEGIGGGHRPLAEDARSHKEQKFLAH